MLRVERMHLSEFAKNVGQVDVLLCSASYESRCKCIPNALRVAKPGVAYVCRNRDSVAQTGRHAEEILGWFGRAGREVLLDRANPLVTADELNRAIRKIVARKPSTVLVDITTFTHEALLMLTKLLCLSSLDPRSVLLAYTAASDYSVGLSDRDKWLSKGIKEVRTVLGYPGEMLPSRKCHLIVLVGFEAERAKELVESYEPSVLSLGIGEEQTSLSVQHHRLNRFFHEALTQRFAHYNEFSFSPINPFSTTDALKALIRRTDNVNVVIAAMNTKLSSVGAAIVAIQDESIQLCYASAMQYNVENYSIPSDHCFVVQGAIPKSPRRKLA